MKLNPFLVLLCAAGLALPAHAQSNARSGLGPTLPAPQEKARPAPPPALPGSRGEPAAVAPATKLPGDMAPTEALFDSINRGDTAAGRDAISRGADLNARNVLGLTPLELAVDLGRPELSVGLFGAARTWHQTYGFNRFCHDQPHYDKAYGIARRQVGLEDWDAAFGAGCRRTPEQAQSDLERAIIVLTEWCEHSLMTGLTSREIEVLRHVSQGISDADIVGLNVPNGQPLVYELDADLKPLRSYYLGDADAIAAAMQAVASQGRAK